jgi:hypothetical protein
MVREDRVTMSGKELRRVHVVRQVMDKQLTQVKAGALLGLTPRQMRRLLRRVEQDGDPGLVHRGRGKPSNRRIPEKRKAMALQLYEQRYGDFGPTLAAEKLAERDGITLSDETLRLLVAGERGDTFFAAQAPAPGMASPQGSRRGTHPTRRLTSCLVRRAWASLCPHGLHR